MPLFPSRRTSNSPPFQNLGGSARQVLLPPICPLPAEVPQPPSPERSHRRQEDKGQQEQGDHNHNPPLANRTEVRPVVK